MDYKALYKGSLYVAVWIGLYLVVKYAFGAEISDIDAALTASVLTLLLLITENMMYLRTSARDHVKEQVEKQKLEGFQSRNSNGSHNAKNVSGMNSTKGANVSHSARQMPTPGAGSRTIGNPSKSMNDTSSDMSSSSMLSNDLSSSMSSDMTSSSGTGSNKPIAVKPIAVKPNANSSQITGPTLAKPLKPGDVPINNIPVNVPKNVKPSISGVHSYDEESSTISSDISSDVSSDISSDTSGTMSSDAPNPSAGATNVPDIMRNIKVGSSSTPGMSDPNMNVDLPAGSVINTTKEETGDTTVYYSESDYLGEQVIFDRNEFGGTADDPVVFRKNQTFGIVHSDPQVAGVDTDSLDNGSNIASARAKTNNGTVVATPAQAANGAIKSNNVIMMPHTVSSADTGLKIDVPMAPKMREVAPGDIMADMGNPSQTTVDRTGETKWYEQKFDPRNYTGAENLDQIAVSGGRTRNDLLVNQYKYSDFNRMPPSFNADDFEYGYSYLPPRDWYPLPPYPPVCVSNSTCPVQGVYTDTMTMDLKEWRDTLKITPPDSINTAFITNELNSKV